MRRSTIAVALLLSLLLGVAAAAAKPPSALTPAEVTIYEEINLDQVVGDTPTGATLRGVLASSQVVPAARKLLADDPATLKMFDQVLEIAGGVVTSLGPRLAYSMSVSDIASAVSSGSPPEPEFVVVANLRDRAAFEATLASTLKLAAVPSEPGEAVAGAKIMTFAGGQVALAIGDDWAAFTYPAANAAKVAALAAGSGEGSLQADPAFQRALAPLPKDALVTEYLSGQFLKQLVAMVTVAVPSLDLPPPPADGIACASRLNIEQKGDRRMLTVTWSTDLDQVAYFVQAPLVSALVPQFTRAQGASRKTQCLSNMKNLSMAVQMYGADYDKFPKADKWVDVLDEYVANRNVFHCPEDKSGARSSYGFNWGLSGKKGSVVKDPAKRVVIYETAKPGQTPRGGRADVVTPGRHEGGNNYGFADGHAQWLDDAAAKSGGMATW